MLGEVDIDDVLDAQAAQIAFHFFGRLVEGQAGARAVRVGQIDDPEVVARVIEKEREIGA